MTDDETIWVAKMVSNRGGPVYHTDPECRYVTDSHREKPASFKNAVPEIRECQACSGALDPTSYEQEHIARELRNQDFSVEGETS